MVKLNYFFKGFIGTMQSKEFDNREAAETFLNDNKETVETLTATILPA